MMSEEFAFWRRQNTAPFSFPMEESVWRDSMFSDVDGDGRPLFSRLETSVSRRNGDITGLIQYGKTAFGFDASGEISKQVSYSVIRTLCFDPAFPEDGETLLRSAMADLDSRERIYAFFHYFGMSVCARHGKLHESASHVEKLLLDNGFVIEHENVYYARALTSLDTAPNSLRLIWGPLTPGGCRSFTAFAGQAEIGWGQVHFLPQGDIAYLRWLCIDEKRQHQGFGSGVLQQLFGQLYRMGIRRFDTDTALSNTAAQSCYEKNGFSFEGITRSYHTHGVSIQSW